MRVRETLCELVRWKRWLFHRQRSCRILANRHIAGQGRTISRDALLSRPCMHPSAQSGTHKTTCA